MPTDEEGPAATGRPYLRTAVALVVLAEVFVAVFSWAEGRPWSGERGPDLIATALMAAAAGLCLGFARDLSSSWRAPAPPDEALDPTARSRLRGYRAVHGFGATVMLLSCALLLLFAVSIGTGHGEWVSWFPSRGHSRYRFDF